MSNPGVLHCINAKGLACPKPVILAKKYWEEQQSPFQICVDNEMAVQNLRKLAKTLGLSFEYQHFDGDDGLSILTIGQGFEGEGKFVSPPAADVVVDLFASPAKEAAKPVAGSAPETSPAVVDLPLALFVGKNRIGEGDASDLGERLATMLLYTLTVSEDKPSLIVFMNSGVLLAKESEQVRAHLQQLQEEGVRLMSCGTCLQHYQVQQDEYVGEVANMYDIWSALAACRLINLA